MHGLITGIHHVTALAGDPQKNLEFYGGVLGLRLVKKTVNFDAPDTYHLYFGDREGLPGSVLTFFPYGDIPPGRRGSGMLNVTSFSAPTASLSFWEERLSRFGVSHERGPDRFPGETVLSFQDHDGLGLELVFNEMDTRPGNGHGSLPIEHSIRGFHGVEIWEDSVDPTVSLLIDHLDHKPIAESGNRHRFAATDTPGNYVDIVHTPSASRGKGGKGTVHHIAFATGDASAQREIGEALMSVTRATPVIDRQYFTSIYFHEPGGMLFEVATVGPGFAVDEPKDRLGESLKLPAQYEPRRTQIESGLPPISLKAEAFR